MDTPQIEKYPKAPTMDVYQFVIYACNCQRLAFTGSVHRRLTSSMPLFPAPTVETAGSTPITSTSLRTFQEGEGSVRSAEAQGKLQVDRPARFC
jgi:hypothetical protein